MVGDLALNSLLNEFAIPYLGQICVCILENSKAITICVCRQWKLMLSAGYTMYILASVFFEKDDKHVFKARNSCCV